MASVKAADPRISWRGRQHHHRYTLWHLASTRIITSYGGCDNFLAWRAWWRNHFKNNHRFVGGAKTAASYADTANFTGASLRKKNLCFALPRSYTTCHRKTRTFSYACCIAPAANGTFKRACAALLPTCLSLTHHRYLPALRARRCVRARNGRRTACAGERGSARADASPSSLPPLMKTRCCEKHQTWRPPFAALV